MLSNIGKDCLSLNVDKKTGVPHESHLNERDIITLWNDNSSISNANIKQLGIYRMNFLS